MQYPIVPSSKKFPWSDLKNQQPRLSGAEVFIQRVSVPSASNGLAEGLMTEGGSGRMTAEMR